MKNLAKSIFTFLLTISTNFIFGQNFEGKAMYFSKQKIEDIESVTKDKNPELSKQIEAAIRKATEKEYLLSFNKFESVFEEVQKLDSNAGKNSGITIMMSGQGKKYLNRKENKQIFEDDIFGKEFLVSDQITNRNWELKPETKQIGVYLCNKATSIVKVTIAEKEEYEQYLKDKSNQKTSLLFKSAPKDNIVTAWYTAEIPVNHGPDKYSGLPGLILEINNNDVILLCSKVTLNPKDKIKIQIPNSGKIVSQKEFDAIEEAKMDSLKDKDGNIIFKNIRE